MSGGRAGQRLVALDALRGLIMVLMALDHASFFVGRVHPFEFWSGKLPDYGGSAAWFLTREVSHLCAPGFFFLMGAGMALFAASRRGGPGQAAPESEAGQAHMCQQVTHMPVPWGEWRITKHFVSRGLLLIPVSYLVESVAWMLPFALEGGGPPAMAGGGQARGVTFIIVMVLVALGLTMALCGPLMRLGARFWVALGSAAVLAPNIAIPLYGPGDPVGYVMRVFLVPGATPPVDTSYAVLPWLGLCALGIAFGQALTIDRERWMRAMLPVGFAFVAGFFVVRTAGGFGNLRLADGAGWIPFFTVVKYPPSLAFVLLTMGVNLVLLWLFHKREAAWGGLERVLAVYGQSPLFFYLAHLYVFSLMRVALFRQAAAPLPVMYAAWFAGVALLYPACKWYRGFKMARPAGSFWRLF